MIEKTDLTLGIVPLTDCAPIAVAVEHGYFRRHGLSVTTSREESWAGIRDKVAFGVLDAAQMIAPMTLATTLGIGGVRCDLTTAMSLDLNGNAITLSAELFAQMADAEPDATLTRPCTAAGLKRVIERRQRLGLERLRFGIVFPVSTHNYELRYWLAAGGINPDRDVELVVVPPPKMVDAMKAGHLHGFCVGEPWNSVAVCEGVGRVAITKHELWNNSPEKVLGVSSAWAEQHPEAHLALVAALIEACRWIDEPEHRREVADILALPQYVGVDAELIARSMTGTFRYAPDAAAVSMPDFNVFHRYAANFPWRSHAVWFLTQMQRWGQLDETVKLGTVAAKVYRPDRYRLAAERVGEPVPTTDSKTEGSHLGPWTLNGEPSAIAMGPDRWFDTQQYDPGASRSYLAQLTKHAPASR